MCGKCIVLQAQPLHNCFRHEMRNSWFTTIAVCVVIGLLTLFLGLQYNWLNQASDAERERMQKRLEIDAKNFADSFNREIQGAYFNFQADPQPIEQGNAAEVAERYDYWKQNTEFPALISEIIYISNGQDPKPRRFDPSTRSLEPFTPDGRSAAIFETIKGKQQPGPVLEKEFALVVPIHASGHRVERLMLWRKVQAEEPMVEVPTAAGYFVVLLNEAAVKEQVLPALTTKHFSPNEYSVGITNTQGDRVFQTAATSSHDASAALFDLTPDNLIFFAKRESLPRQRGSAESSVVVNRRVESQTLNEELNSVGEGSKTFTIEMKDSGAKKRTAVVSSTNAGSPWTLNVQHTSGSIDAFVRNERNKSMLIGFGVYLLLVASILAIVISANGARNFARRQIAFVSSVSHEFRTPLAVIYSAGENLADGVAKDEAQVSRYGDLIKGEGKKLSGMVEQILEFAGARSGRKKYSFVSADVADITKRALQECSAELESKGFDIETDIDADLPAVKADVDALSSAIQNLIQNSIKYSRGSRWIRVSAANGNGTVKVSVEDRGIGIAGSELKQIFKPFYRAKEVVDAQIHGNGLGLSLVKEIAEAHGGKVQISSEPGKGSKFTIELPQF